MIKIIIIIKRNWTLRLVIEFRKDKIAQNLKLKGK
jgi:hypothetical protein